MVQVYMVLLFIKKLLFILFLMSSTNVWATDYYISTTGNDSDPGTEAQPFLTMQKGVDSAVNPDDQVLVNDGTYAVGFVADDYSGSAESTQNITGITQANPCIVTVVGHGYSNGDLVAISALARYNTTGMQHLNNHWFTVSGATADTFQLSGVDSTYFDIYISGGTVRRIHPIKMKAINRGAVIIDGSAIVTGWSNSGLPANTYLSSVFDGRESLWKVGNNKLLSMQSSAANVNAENEYFYDDATFKFTIYTTSNPNLSVYKQTVGAAIAVKGVSWILIDGFTGQYGSVPISLGYTDGFPTSAEQLAKPGTTDIMVQYCTAQYAVTWGMAAGSASTNNTSRVTFDNVTIQYVDERAGGQNGHCFKFPANVNNAGGTFGSMSNSLVHDCRYHGWQTSNGWSNSSFFGNTVYNTSLKGSGGGADVRSGYTGQTSNPSKCSIFDNDLGGASGGTGVGLGTGIYLQELTVDTHVFRNRIHDHKWHGIFSFAGSGMQNGLIFNNLIYNNLTSGVRLNNNTSTKIYNNSFYNNGEVSSGGIGAAMSINNNFIIGVQFFNNICHNSLAACIGTLNSFALSSDNNVLYSSSGFNVVWNNTTYTSLDAYSDATLEISGFRQDGDSFSTDPLYASPAVGDFRIPSPTTPADSVGDDLSAIVKTDFTGTARQLPMDIGAYNTQGNLIVLPSITLQSVFPGRTGTATISFTTSALFLDNDWKIVFTFPAEFVLDNGGLTVASSTDIDGTLTTSIVGQEVTIERNGDGNVLDPGPYSFVLTNVKNPSTFGYTDTYSLAINDSEDVEQGSLNMIPGTFISDISPRSLAGLTIGDAMMKP